MKKRIVLSLFFTCLFLAPLVAGAFLLELPLLVLEPGPAPDVARRSTIEAPTFDSKGSMHMTTARVNSPSGSTVVEIIEGLLAGDKHVVPREAVYPQDRTDEQTEGVQAAQMTQSESAAATAALNELGLASIPDGAFVSEVSGSVPAAKKLLAGDVITSAGGKPVVKVGDLAEILDSLKPGDEVALEVRRDGKTKSLEVKAVGSKDRPARAELGVAVSQSHQPPVKVTIEAEDIGGPSAGLMFALSIYDRLVPEDLTGGKKIAGTGTIENGAGDGESGKVGAVGAVDLKIRGAEKIGAKVFLVPKKELDAARSAAHGDMLVIGVATLSDAIEELEKLGR